jgi:dipeptidase E
MWRSGLADLAPPPRRETVYEGLSGGSMAVTPPVGAYNDPKLSESRYDRMLGLVDRKGLSPAARRRPLRARGEALVA